MALIELRVVNKFVGLDQAELPPTLPVIYEDDRIALAVLQDSEYWSNLPDQLSGLLEDGGVVAQLDYRDPYGNIFVDPLPDRVLSGIRLMPAAEGSGRG